MGKHYFNRVKRKRNATGQSICEDTNEYFARNHEVDTTNGCWNWTGNTFGSGYGRFMNQILVGHHRCIHASRAAWLLFRGEIDKGLFVCHKCDNRRCVNPDHLFLGTNTDNMRDCKNKGRTCRGEKRPLAKLTEANVREARRLRQNERIPLRNLAKRYGVSVNCVDWAINGITWAHIDEPIPTVKIRRGGSQRSRKAHEAFMAQLDLTGDCHEKI